MNLILFKLNLKSFIVTLWFFICLLPLVNDEGVSSNYIFIFSIFLLPLLNYKIKLPDSLMIIIIIIFCLMFVFKSIKDINMFFDRTRSFLVFMSIFTFCLIKFDNELVIKFINSVVLMALYLVMESIYKYIIYDGYAIGFEGKSIYGSSRIGFIYIIAAWLIIYKKSYNLFNSFMLLFILIGCFLTFSRSTVFAIFGSSLLWVFTNKLKVNLIQLIIYILLLFILIFVYFENFLTLIYRDMFELVYDSDRLFANLNDINSSEGARFSMWSRAFSYLYDNPLFGSGFLGFKILEEDMLGSAHSQYVDIIFRVGIIGFIIWMSLIVKILIFTFKYYNSLFYGIVGTLFYSFFNETFKLSYGGFIFSFLIGIYSNRFLFYKKLIL